MKRILLGLMTIGIVSAAAFFSTNAYFTDTETSQGNVLSAGTIDIAVNGHNPWVEEESLNVDDLKPSQHAYTEYVIQNVGTNPANIFKKIHVTSQEDGLVSEPECDYGGGTWVQNSEGPGGNCTGSYFPKNDIASKIHYDMTVWVYDQDPTNNDQPKPIWWQVIYTDEDGPMLNNVNNKDVMLGMVPKGWYMKVRQSYHMDKDTPNWAQGDKLTFNITLTAEQLKGTVLMQNKDFANADNPTIVWGDTINGQMDYTVRDDAFNWSFDGKAPLPNEEYALLFYYESWSYPAFVNDWPNRDVYVLDKATSGSDGVMPHMSGSVDFNHDVTNMKVWLVPTSDLASNATGNNSMKAWHGNNYLFELGMMDYYDSIQP